MRHAKLMTAVLLVTATAVAGEPARSAFETAQVDSAWNGEEFAKTLGDRGKDNWEFLCTGNGGALFRKPIVPPVWEYKTVKFADSPFSAKKTEDNDAYVELLDRMAADGFIPCGVDGLAEHTLFKRAKDAKPTSGEYRVLMLADVVTDKSAPADRWKAPEFLTALNKDGSQGWEWCVGNPYAAVLRKGPTHWEYKTVRVTASPLVRVPRNGEDEAEAFRLVLEGLEAKGWVPCSTLIDLLMFKRELRMDQKK